MNQKYTLVVGVVFVTLAGCGMIQINSDQPNNTINPDVATSGNQESQAVSEDELFEKVIVHSETEIERLLIYIGEGEANIDYGAPVNDIKITVEEN